MPFLRYVLRSKKILLWICDVDVDLFWFTWFCVQTNMHQVLSELYGTKEKTCLWRLRIFQLRGRTTYNQKAILEHPMAKSVLGSEYIKPTNLQWLNFYTVRPILGVSAEKLNFEGILYVTAKPLLVLPVLPSILPSGTSLAPKSAPALFTHWLCTHPSQCTCSKIGNDVWAQFLFLLKVFSPSFLPHCPLFPRRRFPHQDTGSIPTTELLQPRPPAQLCAHWRNAARSRSRAGFKNSTLITVIKVRVPDSSKDSWAV